MIRALPLVLLAACGPKLDPLAAMKAEVGAARQQGPTGPAHVRLVLAEQPALQVLEDLAQLDRPRLIPLGGIGAAKVSADLGAPELSLSPGTRSTRLEISVGGRFDASVTTLLGSMRLAEGMGFEAQLAGALRLGVRWTDEGQDLVLVPVESDPWTSTVRLEEQKGPLSDEMVSRQIANALDSLFARETRILHIPPETPLRLQALELVPAEHPTLDVWLQAAASEEPAPTADPEDGFVVAWNASALLAALRASFALADQHDTWRIEPTGATLQEDGFELRLKIHKAARRQKWREVRVTGELAIDDRITLRTTAVEELGHRGFRGSLLTPFVRRRIAREAMALDLDLPAGFEQPLGQRAVRWTIDGLEAARDGYRLTGSLEVVDRVTTDSAATESR